jgi:carbon monoxide dehydrogenase subunit G
MNSMDMTGERRLPAPRSVVWDALNDTDVLKASIPGCESLEKTGDNEMKATASVKVGPISAKFNGKVQLSDIDPPSGYRISGEGQGGVAGFAKGGASVSLTDDGDGTVLAYTVNAQVGGKLAQLGGRLIDATAKQMADAFFDRFSKQVEARTPAQEGALSPAAAEEAASHTMAEPVAVASHVAPPPSSVSVWALIPPEPFGLPVAFWIGGGIFGVLVLLILGSML